MGFVLLGVTGCATAHRDEKSGIAGHYAMIEGGFNESMDVELAGDGSYILDHLLVFCTVGPDGVLPISGGREEGVWKFEGDVLVLKPRTLTKDFPDAAVFAPALARRLRPTRDGFSQLLVSVEDPQYFILKKTSKISGMSEPAL